MVDSAAARLALIVVFICTSLRLHAACTGCTTFDPGVSLGTVSFNALSEASGLAASRRNYMVLWSHNDGSRNNIYAMTTNGTRLATFDLGVGVSDVEDIAVGPGPVGGVHYLYVGDIGGAGTTNGLRSSVQLLRTPEPPVEYRWATNARSLNFNDVDTFTLEYPDGSYDTEALMVDPLNSDVWIATKQNGSTRLYRANVNAATNQQTLTLEFVRTVSFGDVSGGDISPDGTQIVLRREEAARLWQRCDGEAISAAFSRAAVTVPVIGPPVEPNGEGITFLPDNSGYMTISESNNPALYFFRATCPRAPQFMIAPTNQNVFMGGSVTFVSAAAGNATPSYVWRLGTQVIAAQTGPSLTIANVNATNEGEYTVTASNANGTASASATLVVRPKPDLRITEVMSSPISPVGVTTADWWELTSFETQPVSMQGWRFNDNSGGFTDPFTISAPVVIAPGESIVFVEAITRAQFINWWGATNVPAALQVVTYTGGGLGLGAGGDSVNLWDGTTVDVADTVASATVGNATTGVSFGYDPAPQQFGGLSQLGVNGVVRAAASTDIGSPGRIRTTGPPPTLRGYFVGDEFQIEFNATAGSRYRLETRNDFDDSDWSPTGDVLEPANNGVVFFTRPKATTARYYRVAVE
jgi:hypothetical protein